VTLESAQGWQAIGRGAVLFLDGMPLQVRASDEQGIAATVAELETLTGEAVRLGPLAVDGGGLLVGSVATERRKGAA